MRLRFQVWAQTHQLVHRETTRRVRAELQTSGGTRTGPLVKGMSGAAKDILDLVPNQLFHFRPGGRQVFAGVEFLW